MRTCMYMYVYVYGIYVYGMCNCCVLSCRLWDKFFLGCRSAIYRLCLYLYTLLRVIKTVKVLCMVLRLIYSLILILKVVTR